MSEQAKPVEAENETVVILNDDHVQPSAAWTNSSHPHHKREVICKKGVNAVTLGPSIFHAQEVTYMRTTDTKDGLAVFRKAPG